MSKTREILNILEEVPETWLAYNLGQNFERLSHVFAIRPRFHGTLLRLALLILWAMKQTTYVRKSTGPAQGSNNILVYAGTFNQLVALDGTVKALAISGRRVSALAKKKQLESKTYKDVWSGHRFSLKDTLIGFKVLIHRAPKLRRLLGQKNPRLVAWHLDQICSSYFYLASFYRTLKAEMPEYVVTANDHNVDNRALISVAHYLGIKTAYLQHASVGPLFPALRFNYAFLDGEAARTIYRQCENHIPDKAKFWPKPKVFLSGQKKPIASHMEAERKFIGIAVNTLDDPEKVTALVGKVVNGGYAVRFRWHPGQSTKDVELYKVRFSRMSGVTLSNSRNEDVATYLSGLKCLVAANTSLLLEGALARVVPVYYEFSEPAIRDVYGFVKNGLAEHAESVEDLLDMLVHGNMALNQDAIKHYSATFNTVYEGRESELVAGHLNKLSQGENPESLWGYCQ